MKTEIAGAKGMEPQKGRISRRDFLKIVTLGAAGAAMAACNAKKDDKEPVDKAIGVPNVPNEQTIPAEVLKYEWQKIELGDSFTGLIESYNSGKEEGMVSKYSNAAFILKKGNLVYIIGMFDKTDGNDSITAIHD